VTPGGSGEAVAPGGAGPGFHFRRAQDRPQQELCELARCADVLGYRTVWVSEAWGRDAFLLLARLATVTSRVRLGTGIVNVWGRSPGTLAQAVATLDEASGGRAVLGIGVSGPKVVRDWHGAAWREPLARLVEVTDVVRLALAGGRVDYQGRHFRLSGFRLQFAPPRREVPIFWGAYGPRAVETAAARADGWLAGELSARQWERARRFHESAAKAGREHLEVSLMLQVTACDTEDQWTQARRLLRRDLAFRIAGLGEFHRRSLASQGFGPTCEKVLARWRAGDREGATAAVSDGLVEAMGCVGSPEEAAAYVARARRAGVTEPVVTVPRGTPTPRILATLAACARS
jgi:probable F420-dependent oxidoreductase